MAAAAAISLLAPAALAYSRVDTALVNDRATLAYTVVRNYNGNEAQGERFLADTDNSTFVTTAEANAYAGNIVNTSVGNPTGTLRWDNAPTYWTSMSVSTVFLAQRNTDKHSLAVTLSGEVNLTSLDGIDHTVTLIPPSGGGLDFSLSVPANWTIVSVSGANVTSNSSTAVSATVGAGGLALITVREPAPPPPPNDVLPPVVSAGGDRSIFAGDPTPFNGSATDDDPGFPVGALFWWTFTYNATPVNLSSRDISFTFWTLGTYTLTFTAVDRSGNRADSSVAITVLSPDTVAPVLGPPAELTVDAGTPLTVFGNATDNDPAFPAGARFSWSFAHNGTPILVLTENVTFTFWTLGVYALSFSATDAWGNTAVATVRVTVVSPDTEPPTIGAMADLTVRAGDPVSLRPTVSDNDPAFPAGATFLWTFVYNSTALNIPSQSLAFTFWSIGTYHLTFMVADAWGNSNSTIIHVTVDRPDTQPPVIDLGPPLSVGAGTTVALAAQVTDNDPSFPGAARFYWVFDYGGIAVNLTGISTSFTFFVLGTYALKFAAVDAWGNYAEATLDVTVTSPDLIPPTIVHVEDTTATLGTPVLFHANATDNDVEFATKAAYYWTFANGQETTNLSGKDVAFTFGSLGNYTVTLEVRDAWGNSAFDEHVVTVEAAPPPPPSVTSPTTTATSADGGWLLPLALVGMVGASAVGAAAYRRRSRQEAELEAARAAAASAVLAPPSLGPTHTVEGLLILYKDGRLIHHQSPGAEAAIEDPEILGSMFTAVTEFIRDSFGQEGALSKLTYGQNTIVLDRSAHLFGAAIVYGEPDAELGETLKETLGRLESAYAGVVERWYGDRDAFAGIETFVAPIFAATAGLSRAAVRAATGEKTVKLVSGTEHYKGYVRLRVAVANQTDGKLTDVAVTVVFNQNVLRLAKIEPAGLVHEGLTVHIGDVGPGERQGAIYYLDPQTCSRTNIEGIARYVDASGEEQTVSMKPRTEEIVCPVFFTPHHANPGMMKRLIETSLAARDAKLYRVRSIPAGQGYIDIFGALREAVQAHHVVLVRNIATRSPFEGKAWFYGQTKHSKSPVIIRATVSEDRRAIEIFVAVDSPATLTGLLADFHRSFTDKIRERAPGLELEPVLDDALKGLMSSDEFEASDGDAKGR